MTRLIWGISHKEIFENMLRLTRLIWGISHKEIFENMLRLMRFGVYFETEMAVSIKK